MNSFPSRYALPFRLPSAVAKRIPCLDGSSWLFRRRLGIKSRFVMTPAAIRWPSATARWRRWSHMANKDEAALGELYDLTVRRLHAFALRIVRDTGLAEEVTEDALFQAWREANRFDAGRGKVITWLLTILPLARAGRPAPCRHCRIRWKTPTNSAPGGQPDGRAGQLIGQFEAGSAVHNALLQLPAKERQAVSLAFFRGLTHQEIAEHWQMPLGSVKNADTGPSPNCARIWRRSNDNPSKSMDDDLNFPPMVAARMAEAVRDLPLDAMAELLHEVAPAHPCARP